MNMRIMKKIVTALLCLAFLTGSGDTLYWQITDQATVDGGSIVDFVEDYGTYEWNSEIDGQTYSSYNVAARVKVTGNHLSSPVYLPVYFGDGMEVDGEFGIDLNPETGGYWGCGVPTGIQSPLEGIESELFMECMFMVELGEITYDEVFDILDWTTVAQTDKFAASKLTEYIHERFVLSPPDLAVWSPTAFYTHQSVPEPSSALLCIIGFGMLMLRRKTSKWEIA